MAANDDSIISTETAQKLNERVAKIDPRLFLCCNYQPISDVFPTVSEDAWFLRAVQDLYCFAIDSCVVIKNWRTYLCGGFSPDLSRIDEYIEQIRFLRSVFSHTQSKENGWIQSQRLSEFNTWIMGIIGKEKPDSQEDYGKLNQAVRKLAESLIERLYEFIDLVAALPEEDKARAVELWIDNTLRWYTRNTKTEIYEGQLMNSYLSRAPGMLSNDISRKELRKKVNSWIKESVFYELDCAIEDAKAEIKEIEKMNRIFLHPNPQQQKLLSSMSEEQRSNSMKAMEDRRDKMNERLARCLKDREGLEKTISRQPGNGGWKEVNYFWSCVLFDELKNTMRELDGKGISYTLLPHSLLSYHIVNRFAGIPSSDGDF